MNKKTVISAFFRFPIHHNIDFSFNFLPRKDFQKELELSSLAPTHCCQQIPLYFQDSKLNWFNMVKRMLIIQ